MFCSRSLGWALAICLMTASTVQAQVPTVVPTFESFGIDWSPVGGGDEVTCSVRYREVGTSSWREGHPLWFDARNSEYRGSLVGLRPGANYEIELSLAGEGAASTLTASTWDEDFPVGEVIEHPELSNKTLEITESGSPGAYIVHSFAEGSSATIDVADKAEHNIVIDASFVIIRGLTLRGASSHAIVLGENAHDIVIENCDISGWGRIDTDGWGVDYQAGVYSQSPSLTRVIIQRNRIHHPRADANNWSEPRPANNNNPHPAGPQAVTLYHTGGNHVIRYNDIYSDDEHRFNDGLGAGSNRSFVGFPNRDSDIYGNRISHCWDDAIESEGANRNVRIWGNYIDQTFVAIAIASTSVGPLYIFRNLSGVSRSDPDGPSDDANRGPFIKAGGRDVDGTYYGGGRTYVFHNTIRQPEPEPGMMYGLGAEGITDSGGELLEVVTRNNILHIPKDWHSSIDDDGTSPTNDFDYDLYSGRVQASSGQEAHGIRAVPIYAAENGEGEFALAPSSPGYDDAALLAGFNDDFLGSAPDRGAFEAGRAPMEFGVSAYLVPAPPPDGGETPDAGPGSDGGGAASQGDALGCGCRTTRGRGTLSWLGLVLITLGLVSLRRSRRAIVPCE